MSTRSLVGKIKRRWGQTQDSTSSSSTHGGAGTVEPMGMMDCKAGKRHSYDESGWCAHGCGVRDDGRVISWQGDVLRQSDSEYQSAMFRDF